MSLTAGTVTGVVSNSVNNNPVSGAQVLALGFSSSTNDSLIFAVISGPGGAYFLSIPIDGTYKIITTHPDFITSVNGPFQINGGANITLNIALQPRNNTSVNMIAGRVRIAGTELPLPGVKVMLMTTNAAGTGMFTYSDFEGKYQFLNIIPGIYSLSAQKDSFVNYSHNQPINVTPTTRIENLNFSLAPAGGSLTATVTGGVYSISSNAAGVPVPGAHITFTSANGLAYSAYSDSTGRYLLSDIPAGGYMAKCVKEGYATRTLNNIYLAPNSVDSVNFFLEPLVNTNFVKGQVKNSVTNAPIEGVHVGLSPGNMLPVIYQAITNAEGRYGIFNIPPGVYRLTAFKEGFNNYIHNETINITATTQISNLDILLVPSDPTLLATVTGKVMTGTSAGTATPVAGAKITLFGPDSLIYIVFSDNQGNFIIQDVLPGIYNAICSKEGFATVTRYPYNVVPGNNTLQFYLQPQGGNTFGVISGVVTFDGQNLPVPYALIEFLGNNPSLVPFTARTNASGAYHKELPAGTYIVSVVITSPDSNNFYREYFDNVQNINEATPVTLQAGTNVSNINFGVPGSPVTPFTFTITGVVRGANNTPVQGAMVKIISPISSVPPTPAFGAVTNEQGVYTLTVSVIQPVQQYMFYLAATKEGYAPQFYDHKAAISEADLITVQNGTNLTDINFDLVAGGSTGSYRISGRVTDAEGDPLAGVFVITSKAVSAGQLIITITDTAGYYTTQALQSGKYYNLFLKEGYIPEFYDNAIAWENATPLFINGANLTGIDASLASVNITLSFGIFAGFVKDELGAPISGAIVNLVTGDGTIRSYAIADETGYYTIEGIGAANYDLTATQVGYLSSNHNVTYNPQNGTLHTVDFTLSQSPASDVGNDDSVIPTELKVMNYPNPFNPATKIHYSIPAMKGADGKGVYVRLKVYDILGNEAAALVDDYKQAGTYTVGFDAADLPSGIYIYELRAGNTRVSGKMMLMK